MKYAFSLQYNAVGIIKVRHHNILTTLPILTVFNCILQNMAI